MGIIYKAINKINGKSYIGQTKHSLNFRRSCGYGNTYFQRALNQYGIEGFKWSILETCQDKELGKKEIFYIDKYNTFQDGYNCTKGGESPTDYWKGKTFSKEHKQKISESNKGIIRPNMKGKKHSEKTKEKIRMSLKGKKRKPFSKKWKENIRKAALKNVKKRKRDKNGRFI